MPQHALVRQLGTYNWLGDRQFIDLLWAFIESSQLNWNENRLLGVKSEVRCQIGQSVNAGETIVPNQYPSDNRQTLEALMFGNKLL